MARRKTKEEYANDLIQLNTNIVAAEPYITSATSIRHRCTVCNNEFKTRPTKILGGQGCPNCTRRKSNEQYCWDLLRLNPNIIAIDTYVTSSVAIKHQCMKCSHIFTALPNNILNGKGCSICSREMNSSIQKKTQEQYSQQLKDLSKNISVVEEYIDAKTYILHRCDICNNQWKDSPTHILGGRGCPSCTEKYNGFGSYKDMENMPKKAYLYILDILLINGEHFLKVGVTVQKIEVRVNSLSCSIDRINIEHIKVLHTVETTGEIVLKLEKLILHNLSNYKYNCSLRFAGHTELLKLEALPKIIRILNENI